MVLTNKDPDSVQLLNYKKPVSDRPGFKTKKDRELDEDDDVKVAGDFPTTLMRVIEKRSSVIEGSLTVQELNEILDEIAQNIGKLYVIGFIHRSEADY